jgi:uncharacterized protein (DUF305 family)
MIVSGKLIAVSAAFSLLASISIAAHAQSTDAGHDMSKMNMSEGASSPAATGYMKAMDAMDETMADIEYTGDPDVDFALGMIPHHQAAIDMAKVQLQYGKDPEIRKLSQDIIAAQEREIGQLKTWLANHPAAQ